MHALDSLNLRQLFLFINSQHQCQWYNLAYIFTIFNTFSITDDHRSLWTGVPGQPKNLTVSVAKDGQVQLHWNAPTSDGGAPITNYVVEKSATPTGDNWKEVIAPDSTDTKRTIPPTKGEFFRGSSFIITYMSVFKTFRFMEQTFCCIVLMPYTSLVSVFCSRRCLLRKGVRRQRSR